MDEAKEKQMDIQHPEVWSLAIHLQPACLKYTLHSTVEDNSLTFGTIDFSNTASSYEKEVEAAVYDNPFLVTQFGQTTIVADSERFLLIPDEMAPGGDAGECRRYYDFIYPGDERTLIVNRIGELGLSLAFGIPQELDSFLRRTFYNPPVLHCLTPMIRLFKKRDAYGARNKMFVFLNNGQLEIVAFRDGSLTFANAFPYSNTDDAFYYAMNAWTQCRMDGAADEMHVVGDRETKAELLPRLRSQLKSVVQVVFPSGLLRLGRNAMSAPFDLISLSQCE